MSQNDALEVEFVTVVHNKRIFCSMKVPPTHLVSSGQGMANSLVKFPEEKSCNKE